MRSPSSTTAAARDAGFTKAPAATGTSVSARARSTAAPPADPPTSPIGPSPTGNSVRSASTAPGSSAAACSMTGPMRFIRASSYPSRMISSGPPAAVLAPNIGRPRYTRHAGTWSMGRAAAMARSLRGGSIMWKTTTRGAPSIAVRGGTARYGTPDASPVRPWLIRSPPRLPQVPFDRPGIPDPGLLGVQPRGPPCPTLVQQVPALVEGDLDLLQPLAVGLGGLPAPLPLEQFVLELREFVDAVDHVRVVHVPLLRSSF